MVLRKKKCTWKALDQNSISILHDISLPSTQPQVEQLSSGCILSICLLNHPTPLGKCWHTSALETRWFPCFLIACSGIVLAPPRFSRQFPICFLYVILSSTRIFYLVFYPSFSIFLVYLPLHSHLSTLTPVEFFIFSDKLG